MPLPRRVLLLGGSGQLGSELLRLWRSAEISAPSHAELDIADGRALRDAIVEGAFDVVVNCAAFHNVERCESEPQAAFATNALAVSAMAEHCAQSGSVFATFSTDYVFDGALGRPYGESDAPRPLNVYGVSKYAGELLAQRLRAPVYIIRTCGVYGLRPSRTKGYTFIDRIVAAARAGEPLRVVDDQVVSPTYAPHLAKAVLQLLDAGAAYAVYHACNEGAVSWYDYACEALRAAGIDRTVEPTSSAAWNSRVRRPAYSALENAALHEIGISLPSWQEGVAAYVQEKLVRTR